MSIKLEKINLIDINNSQPISVNKLNSNNLLDEKIQKISIQILYVERKINFLHEYNHRLTTLKIVNLKKTCLDVIENIIEEFKKTLFFYHDNLDIYTHSLLAKNTSINKIRHLSSNFSKLINILGNYYIRYNTNQSALQNNIAISLLDYVVNSLTLINSINYSSDKDFIGKYLNRILSLEINSNYNELKYNHDYDKLNKIKLKIDDDKKKFNQEYLRLSQEIFNKYTINQDISFFEGNLLNIIDNFYLSLEEQYNQMFVITNKINLFDGEKTYSKKEEIKYDLNLYKNKIINEYRNKINIIKISNRYASLVDIFKINIEEFLKKCNQNDKCVLTNDPHKTKYFEILNNLEIERNQITDDNVNDNDNLKETKKNIFDEITKLIDYYKNNIDTILEKYRRNNVLLLEETTLSIDEIKNNLKEKIKSLESQYNSIYLEIQKNINLIRILINSNRDIKEIEVKILNVYGQLSNLFIEKIKLFKDLHKLTNEHYPDSVYEEEITTHNDFLKKELEKYAIDKSKILKEKRRRDKYQILKVKATKKKLGRRLKAGPPTKKKIKKYPDAKQMYDLYYQKKVKNT